MLEIKTAGRIFSVVKAPPSKSYTNRALLIAALAKGKSVLKESLISDDTKYMVAALREFGIKINHRKNSLVVYGSGGKLRQPKKRIYVGNAGTAMRFLVTLASISEGMSIIDGNKRMRQRPIEDLTEALKGLGVKVKTKGFPPVEIIGGFKGGKTKLKGSVSSQYLSSILMAAPYAERTVEVEILGVLTSTPYVDMTIDIMNHFGVKVINRNYRKFIVKKQQYQPREYSIEGDASNASYFFAAAAVTNGKIKVTGINPGSAQGDIKFADVLSKMGCKIKKGRNFIEVTGDRLKGITIDMNSMPDVVQTLAVVALFAKGSTVIKNIANLRVKETDRIKALAAELRKIGAIVKEGKDSIIIKPNKLHGAQINTYDDHRMAMSFAIAGLRIQGIKLKNPECVNKSFPDFFRELKRLY